MNETAQQESGFGARGLLRILRRRWWVIVGCMLIGAGLMLALALTQEKKYTASASLLFRDSDLDQTLFGSTALVSSSDPAREAATNLKLASLETVSALTAKNLGTSVSEIQSTVDVHGEGQSNVVSVDATYPSPPRAQLVANRFAEQYIEFRRKADVSKIQSALSLVQRELASMTPARRNGPEGRSLLVRAGQLRILSSLQTGNAELVQRATVPTSPSSPHPARDGILGALAGMFIGLLLAFTLERHDRRLRDLEDVESVFQLPLLGVVAERRAYAQRGELDPVEAEAFRLLRARLRYFNVDRDIGSVLVTSATPGDGKSTVAWHLAEAAGSRTARVLLLEIDLRRPTLARERGLKAVPGLAELLTHDIPLHETIQKVPVREGEADGATIDVLVAGLLPPNPAALIESQRMSQLLEILYRNYDFVVIDTPPTLIVSDAMPLIPHVDGVIIVANAARTTRDAARKLRRELDALHAPLLGVVVNRIKGRTAGSYGYGYGYGYEYSAKPGERGGKREEVAAPALVAAPPLDAEADNENHEGSWPSPADYAGTAESEDVAALSEDRRGLLPGVFKRSRRS